VKSINLTFLVILFSSQAIAADFALKAKDFKNGEDIPAKYTCEGENISPELSWTGAPAGTKSFVVIVDDPDAPDPAKPEKVIAHWVIYNLPKTVHTLNEGTSVLPKGAMQGMNEEKEAKYMGPCPPIGKHRYHFKIFALDSNPHFFARPSKSDIEKEITGHILAQSELIGLYAKRNHGD
jgi:Raf kinase inhibitor-like YbhB/YbcL family protein